MTTDFQSTATDEASWFQDLAQYTMNTYATKGIIPASVGVNKPEQSVTDAESFMGAVQGWFAQQRAAKGGGSTDAYDTPVQDTYRERRYQWLSREEGVRQFAYDDATGQQVTPGSPTKGNVTVGIGFNMDAPGAQDRFNAALPMVDYNAVRSGTQNLNAAQIQKLFDSSSGDVEKLVAKQFDGTDLSEHQRLALVSLGYQRPAAIPEVAQAFREGGLPSAVASMLSQPGSAGRRLREVSQFLGAADANDLMTPFMGQQGGAAAAVDDMKRFMGRAGWDDDIRQYVHTGGVGMDPAVSPWCAMFVNAALAHNGLQGTGSQLASSFRSWGLPVADPSQVQKGDVLVAPPSPGYSGHVGLATGRTRMGDGGLEIEMMSSNTEGPNGFQNRAGLRWRDANSLTIRRATQQVANNG